MWSLTVPGCRWCLPPRDRGRTARRPISGMCRMTWASLRVVLVQLLCRPPACGQATEETRLQVEPGPAEMVRQCAVIIAGRLEPDPHRQVVAGEVRRRRWKSSSVFMDRQSAAGVFRPGCRSAPSWRLPPRKMSMATKQGRCDRMGGGHSPVSSAVWFSKTTVET